MMRSCRLHTKAVMGSVCLLAGLAGVWPASADGGAGCAGVGGPYPRGARFPLGLYSLDVRTIDEVRDVSRFGWNLGHTYGNQEELVRRVMHGGMCAFARVADSEEEDARRTIAGLGASESVAWWDLPEEQRYWRAEEFDLIKNLVRWTRRHDPKQRPNVMYIPGHYGVDGIARYVPYLDIIGSGAYPEYHGQPRAWVRHRVRSHIEAIERAGFRVGGDYLRGEKIPIGILMLFADARGASLWRVISPNAAYHDFYASLAAGARGILVFSYFHRRDTPELMSTYESYAKAVREMSAEAELGQALLFGEDIAVRFEGSGGRERTVPFRPRGLAHDVSLPAMGLRAVKWKENVYVVTVNSSEEDEELRGSLVNLPAGASEARVLIGSGRVVVRAGRVHGVWGRLEVRVYRVPLAPG